MTALFFLDKRKLLLQIEYKNVAIHEQMAF